MGKTITTVAGDTAVYKKRNQMQEVWRRFKHNRRAVVGLIMLIFLIFCAVFADIIAPFDPAEQDLTNRLAAPTFQHLFGTDELGRDIFSRIIYGSRISISVGLIAVTISLFGGVTLGAIAGYYGGKLDDVIMRFMDILMAIPSILLNIAIVSALGNGLQNVMIAIGFSSIPGYCRIVRASILSLKEQEFVEASRAAGADDFFIITQHILPNCIAPLTVQASLRIGSAILSCASMSFIGLGVIPPTAEWGAMLSTGRDFIRSAPHLCTFPGAAIMFAIFAMNLIGDGLRDALDPKLKD